MSQREHIIKESSKMFVNLGVKSVRMDDIARELGVSKRTLYEMFGDKNELLFLGVKSFFDDLDQKSELATTNAANILEAVFAGLDHFKNSIAQNLKIKEELRRYYPSVLNKLMADRHEKTRENLEYVFSKGIQEGLIVESVDVRTVLIMFGAIAKAFFLTGEFNELYISSNGNAFLTIITIYFRGVATERGREVIDKIIESKIK